MITIRIPIPDPVRRFVSRETWPFDLPEPLARAWPDRGIQQVLCRLDEHVPERAAAFDWCTWCQREFEGPIHQHAKTHESEDNGPTLYDQDQEEE